MKSPRPTPIPKPMQAIYDTVIALTDAFCRDYLTDEYRDLARAMTATLSRKRPSPLASGQPRTWACGIIHVLGQLKLPVGQGVSASHDHGRGLHRVWRRPKHGQCQG